MYATVLGSKSTQIHTEATEYIPPMTVMTLLESLRSLPYTNQPQALAANKYDFVTIINIRVNILSNCQANGHVASEYLTVLQTGM
jgi:hypothetical protein